MGERKDPVKRPTVKKVDAGNGATKPRLNGHRPAERVQAPRTNLEFSREELATLLGSVGQRQAEQFSHMLEDWAVRHGIADGGEEYEEDHRGRNSPVSGIGDFMRGIREEVQQARMEALQYRIMEDILSQEGIVTRRKPASEFVDGARVEDHPAFRQLTDQYNKLIEQFNEKERDRRDNERWDRMEKLFLEKNQNQTDPQVFELQRQLEQLKQEERLLKLVKESAPQRDNNEFYSVILKMMQDNSNQQMLAAQQLMQMGLQSNDDKVEMLAKFLDHSNKSTDPLETYMHVAQTLNQIMPKEEKKSRMETVMDKFKDILETEGGKKAAEGMANAALEAVRRPRVPARDDWQQNISEEQMETVACPACATRMKVPTNAQVVECPNAQCGHQFNKNASFAPSSMAALRPEPEASGGSATESGVKYEAPGQGSGDDMGEQREFPLKKKEYSGGKIDLSERLKQVR